MIIATVDEEQFCLDMLNSAISEIAPDAEILSFASAGEAAEAVCEGGLRPDLVFLAIRLKNMTGLELARLIRHHSPQTRLGFVTWFPEYAVEAFSLHAVSYILKPVTAARLREEIDHILGLNVCTINGNCRTKVQCFGNFEVYVNEKPLVFHRSRSKEIFAYIVDKKGASCSTRELAAVLFEDRPYDDSLQRYLQTIKSSLCETLRSANLEHLLIKHHGSLAVDVHFFDCDYYQFLAGVPGAVNAFEGEYMNQYEWAEYRIGCLNSLKYGSDEKD